MKIIETEENIKPFYLVLLYLETKQSKDQLTLFELNENYKYSILTTTIQQQLRTILEPHCRLNNGAQIIRNVLSHKALDTLPPIVERVNQPKKKIPHAKPRVRLSITDYGKVLAKKYIDDIFIPILGEKYKTLLLETPSDITRKQIELLFDLTRGVKYDFLVSKEEITFFSDETVKTIVRDVSLGSNKDFKLELRNKTQFKCRSIIEDLDYACIVTGITHPMGIHAAHIWPFSIITDIILEKQALGENTELERYALLDPDNIIPLRQDIHAYFDADIFTFHWQTAEVIILNKKEFEKIDSAVQQQIMQAKVPMTPGRYEYLKKRWANLL